MASEKKPSIYYDRGTIGSSDELDEYGVWVKSEPQDLSSVGAESQESAESQEFAESADFDLPEMEDLPDFSTPADEAAGSEEPLEEPLEEPSEEPLEEEDGLSLDGDLELPDIELEDTTSGEEGDESSSYEFSELPEPDFSEFTEAEPEAEAEEPLAAESSGDEPENLGFTEVATSDFSPDTDIEFDEPIEALDDSSEVPKEIQAASSPGSSAPDLSTQLLMKIADELASIRTELTTLKKDLSGLKAESASEGAEDGQSRGFFDEEDDEKIALTGDELDNILNTADFTEEAGADATEGLGDDFDTQEAEDSISSDPFQEITESPAEEPAIDTSMDEDSAAEDVSLDDITKDLDLDINLEEKDLDELEGELNLEQAVHSEDTQADSDSLPDESIEFDIPMDEGAPAEEELEEPVDLNIEASEELVQLREEGVQPMTPAPEPEDTDFLAEDPLASSQFDEESLDLSDAVIDEPDLSGEIQENPLEEPSLDDISIDLDLGEEIPLDDDTPDEAAAEIESDEAEEEIELPIDEADQEEFSLPAEPEPPAGSKARTSPPEADSGGADLAVIPEGFVVEADDSQEPEEKEGEEAFPEGEELDILESEAAEPEEENAEEILPVLQEEASPGAIPSHLKQELKTVLSYMDQLLESLPDEKIEEFAKSEYFDTYKKLFKELGLV
jgi:hypothetical protein